MADPLLSGFRTGELATLSIGTPRQRVSALGAAKVVAYWGSTDLPPCVTWTRRGSGIYGVVTPE